MAYHQENGADSAEKDELPLDLRLAAIVTLLSSSALKGRTPGKTAALRHHLEAAVLAAEGACHEHLANALYQVLQDWPDPLSAFPAWEDDFFTRPSGQWLH
ncbi:MAG: hypothetical protein LBB51_05035 [Zoogloeaceae bacterium]|jgi:hypothetical protein|nr:hypothetical protein [Zoogloeaceae bacterium]